MKRDESVFFFTLIDFLLTALFFGVVLYVFVASASAAAVQQQAELARELDKIRAATGISHLTELTDQLSRLGPISEAQAAMDVINRAGGLDSVRAMLAMLDSAGGAAVAGPILARARRQGFGLPPCRYTLRSDGRQVPTTIATALASDTSIVFVDRTPAFDSLLARLGLSYSDVQLLRLADFRRAFRRVNELDPTCRYSIAFDERTRYVDARDAAQSAFRLSFVRR